MPKEHLNQIEKKIGEKPVFVISKSYCPFCNKAKQVLRKYNIKPENIEIMEIDNDEDCNEIQVKIKFHGINIIINSWLTGIHEEADRRKIRAKSVHRGKLCWWRRRD